MTRSTLRAWLISAVVLASAASAGAQLSGKLLTSALKPATATAPANAESCNWELENGFKEVQPDRIELRRELAVVLVSGSAEAKPASAEPPRVEVAFSGGTLMPSTIAVRVGTTLLVRNDDEIAHELEAQGLPGLSAEPTTARGRRSLLLKTAGHWPLRDRLVPHVAAHLHVLPDLVAVATLEASGQFSFAGVPAGHYTLKVYHGARELISRPLELPAHPITLDPLTLGVSGETK